MVVRRMVRAAKVKDQDTATDGRKYRLEIVGGGGATATCRCPASTCRHLFYTPDEAVAYFMNADWRSDFAWGDSDTRKAVAIVRDRDTRYPVRIAARPASRDRLDVGLVVNALAAFPRRDLQKLRAALDQTALARLPVIVDLENSQAVIKASEATT